MFVKLPQEYWIHVAQLDFTDAVADHPWFGVLCLLGLGVLAWLVWFVVRPRMPQPLADWHFTAPPVPSTPRPRAAGVAWSELAEKSILLTLLAVIVAEILPSVHLSGIDVALGMIVLVVANTWIVRRHPALHFAARLGLNLVLIYFGSRALSDRGDFPFATGLFFAYLTTLIVVLYDTYRPCRN